MQGSPGCESAKSCRGKSSRRRSAHGSPGRRRALVVQGEVQQGVVVSKAVLDVADARRGGGSIVGVRVY